MRSSNSIMLPLMPLLITTSLKASTSNTRSPPLKISEASSMRSSATNLPSRMAPMVSNMVSIEMSVRNPSRPWLMPTSATLYGAKVRAMLSMVPSPPITMARSACWPRSSSRSTGYGQPPMCEAVSRSSSTLTWRSSRKRASFSSGSAISGLLYLPISATVLNEVFMAELNHNFLVSGKP